MADNLSAAADANARLAQVAKEQPARDAARAAVNAAEAFRYSITADLKRVRFVVHTSKKGNRSIKLVSGHGGPPIAHGLTVWRNLAYLFGAPKDSKLSAAIEGFAQRNGITPAGAVDEPTEGESFDLS